MTYNPTRSTDHQDRGVRRFIEALREQPFLEALAKSYLKQIQAIEAAAWEVMDQWEDPDLSGFSGVALDRLGKLLRRGRKSLSDADYRLALRTQVLINRSSGLAREILVIARRSLPTGVGFVYSEHWPAAFKVTADGPLTAEQGTVLADNLAQAKPVGVGAAAIWLEGDTTAFTLASGTTLEAGDPDKGLGTTTDFAYGGGLSTVRELAP